MEHVFISKSIFFPERGILAVGDLHVGYEHMMIKSGVAVPETQVDGIIDDFKKIFQELKDRKYKPKKIIFLGDIKHYFNYEWKEKFNFNKVMDFLKQHVKDSDIILIKGNHDKFDFSGKKMKNYYISGDIAFFHGHKIFPQIFQDKIKTIVLGHLHPSVLLSDKANVKREKYKCFLVGKFQGKETIIAPSFFGMIEGSAVNDGRYINDEGFSAINPKLLDNFEAHVIGDNGKIYNFGKVRKIKN